MKGCLRFGRLGILGMGLVCAATAVVLVGCGEPTAEQWIARGTADLQRGAVATGVEELDKGLALGGNAAGGTGGAAAWNWLGLGRWSLGDREGAKAAFEASIAAAPGGFEANYNLGLLWLEEGRMEKGIPLLKKAADLKPDDVLALLAIGDYTTRQGRWDLARRMYGVAQKRDGRNPAVETGLGRVALLEGDLARAEDCFMKALELEKGYGPALYNLGVMHTLKGGNGEEASQYFRRYLETEPEGERAQVAADRLGGAVVEQSSFGQASGKGSVAGGKGQPAAAASRQANAETSEAVWKQSAERKSAGDSAGAAELAARAVELAADEGESEAALAVVRRALAEYAGMAGVQVAAGAFWEKRGNVAGAEEAYKKAQALEPGNSTALAALARVAAGREEYDLAVMALKQLLAAEPKNADALWALADLYGDKLGMTGKGIATYREFERVCSTDPRVREVEAKVKALADAEAVLPPMDEEAGL